jgi:hypothetical protein
MGEPTTRRGRQLYGIESDVSLIRLLRQGGDTSQPASGARSRRIGGVRARSAIRHTARQRVEHSRQRPRVSGAWAASRARHPEVRRGSSLRATDSSDPLSAWPASSSSMSSRSHTVCRRIWPKMRFTLPPSPVPAVYSGITHYTVRSGNLGLQSGGMNHLWHLGCADRSC